MAGMDRTNAVGCAIRAQCRSHPVDAAIAALASGQYGVVARTQLLAIGLSRDSITRRVRAGRLHPLYRGVYAVGHTRVCREGRWLAAVLACDGVLGRRAAGANWGLRPYDGRAEVIVRRGHRGRPGVVACRSPVEPDEITVHRGIPTTTVARTLLDLAT